MSSVTHIAGPDIAVEGRYLRQRCAWCGAVLLDHDLAGIAVPEGMDPRPSTWQVGGLVRVEGDSPRYSALLGGPDTPLPDDACAFLDPEVTQ